MIWLVVTAVGLLVAAFGATGRGRPGHGEPGGADPRGGSATPRRRAVARAGSARSTTYLTAASATTSLGVLFVGAVASRGPASAGAGTPRLMVLLVLLGGPLVLFTALSGTALAHPSPRAESVAERVLPVLRPWSRVLGLLLPARVATRPTDFRSIWREGAAVGLRADDEMVDGRRRHGLHRAAGSRGR